MENKNKNYLYFININQKAIVDNNWELNYNHVAILECIKCFSNSKKCQTMTDELGTWYWVKVSKIAQDLPLLGIKEQQIRKLIDKLVEYNLIELNPKNKIYQQFYLRLGSNIDKYLYTNSDTYIQKDNQPIYSSIEEPLYKSIEEPLYKSIDNYNTSNNITNINQTTIKNKANAFFIPLEYIGFTDVWLKWKSYKLDELNQKYKTTATEQTAFNHLLELSNNNISRAEKIVNNAIANGWKGIHPLKEEKNQNDQRDYWANERRKDEAKARGKDELMETLTITM